MRWPAVLALLLLFIGVLVSRWPASNLAARLPEPWACDASGTIWRGRCDPLRVKGKALGTLEWQQSVAPVLRGVVDLDLRYRASGVSLDAQVQRRLSGDIDLRSLRGEADLAALNLLIETVTQRPRGALSGSLLVDRLTAQVSPSGRVSSALGEIRIRNLTQSGELRDLGSWSLTFDGERADDGSPLGRLRDLGGPFAFTGTVQLTAAPGYLLQGQLTPRPGLSPQVLQGLNIYGAPDANGRRNVSLEGQF